MSEETGSPDRDSRGVKTRAVVVGGMVGLFLATAWSVIAIGLLPGRMASDQLRFHEVVVRIFAADLPTPDLSDYRSATSPGYHLVVAAASRVVGDSRMVLQFVGSLFSVALVGVLTWMVASRRRGIEAAALSLPFAASLYVWPAGVWLLPDNAGWLGVLGIIAVALWGGRRMLLWGGLILLALVWMRQIHVWAAGVLWLAAWIGKRPQNGADVEPGIRGEWRWLTQSPTRRLRPLAMAIAASLPAIAAVAWFAWMWGGLTPPMFKEGTGLAGSHQGVNPATPAFVLALVGAFSPFFAGYLWSGALAIWRKHRAALVMLALAGAMTALVVPTGYNQDEGRWGGLWNLVRKFPAPANRSLLLAAMSAGGAMALGAWALALDRRDRWILLGALGGFTLAQTMSHELWQRYVEPMALMVLILASARSNTTGVRNWRAVGPALLAVAFGALTAASIIRSERVPPAAHDAAMAEEHARLGR